MCLLAIHGSCNVCLNIFLLLFSLKYFLIPLVIFLMMMVNNMVLITVVRMKVGLCLNSFFSTFILIPNYFIVRSSVTSELPDCTCIVWIFTLDLPKSLVYIFVPWKENSQIFPISYDEWLKMDIWDIAAKSTSYLWGPSGVYSRGQQFLSSLAAPEASEGRVWQQSLQHLLRIPTLKF